MPARSDNDNQTGYSVRADSPETSNCLKCISPVQYILDQRSGCRSCPPGLICQGNNVTEKLVPMSVWEVDEGLFKLKECPSGYRRISAENMWDQQRCEPCDMGLECTEPPCDECTACAPGKFKSTRSTEPCEMCPQDTYNIHIASTSRSDCTSCPPRSDTGGLKGCESALHCQCNKLTTYRGSGSNASLVCQLCPPGLQCFGNEHVEYVQAESVWDLTEGTFVLMSCPRGHFVYPEAADEGELNAAIQECLPCDAGHQCESDSCVTCTPCPAGFFKDTALPIPCRPCPKNTYNEKIGSVSSADCTSCPSGAYTEEAQTSNTCQCSNRFYTSSDLSRCLACPAGAECDDAGLSCAFRFGDQRCPGKSEPIVGTWTRDQDDLFRLDGCPPGYEKRADSPLTDMCIKCDKVSPNTLPALHGLHASTDVYWIVYWERSWRELSATD